MYAANARVIINFEKSRKTLRLRDFAIHDYHSTLGIWVKRGEFQALSGYVSDSIEKFLEELSEGVLVLRVAVQTREGEAWLTRSVGMRIHVAAYASQPCPRILHLPLIDVTLSSLERKVDIERRNLVEEHRKGWVHRNYESKTILGHGSVDIALRFVQLSLPLNFVKNTCSMSVNVLMDIFRTLSLTIPSHSLRILCFLLFLGLASSAPSS